jgi:hypothetical protein
VEPRLAGLEMDAVRPHLGNLGKPIRLYGLYRPPSTFCSVTIPPSMTVVRAIGVIAIRWIVPRHWGERS